MMRWTRLPIRHRLTLTFAAGLALMVAGLSAFVYIRAGYDLRDTVDAGLSSRAELLVGDLQERGPVLVNVGPSLIDSDRVFAQTADSSGRILQSTSSISRWRLLPPATLRSLGKTAFYERQIPGVDNVARILAVAVTTSRGRFVVMVGASLQDRQDKLHQLGVNLAVGGSTAVLLISAGAWLALAGALRPVERMRREADTISASDTRRRLSPSGGRDEISSLGVTLNRMLDRIAESVARERRLVDRASHELRTPLAIQRMDLDLALSGPQQVGELAAALRSVSAENAHLTRLTEDLLVLSRARGGVLPIRRVETSLPELLAEAGRRGSLLAVAARVSFRAADERVRLDPVWFQQAVHNLVDNAVRHTPPGGQVDVSATWHDGVTSLVVEDTGAGFSDSLGDVFEAFASSTPAVPGTPESTGLGLAVVRMIAEAHGGRAWAENRVAGGGRVTVTIPDELAEHRPAGGSGRP